MGDLVSIVEKGDTHLDAVMKMFSSMPIDPDTGVYLEMKIRSGRIYNFHYSAVRYRRLPSHDPFLPEYKI